MRRKADVSSVVLLLIPTLILASGLVWGLLLVGRDLRVLALMLVCLGALLIGFRQAGRAQRDDVRGGGL